MAIGNYLVALVVCGATCERWVSFSIPVNNKGYYGLLRASNEFTQKYDEGLE